MQRNGFRLTAAWFVLVALAACGNASTAEDVPGEIGFGWTALGDVPWDPVFYDHVGIWSGSDLIVLGGESLSDSETEVSFTSETFAFSRETLEWRQLEALPLEGYDGVVGVVGSSTEGGWVGLGYPCRSGSVRDASSTIRACESVPVQLGYTDIGGWTVSPLSAQAAEAFSAASEATVLRVVGADPGQVVITGPAGLVSLRIGSALSAVQLLNWSDLGVGPAVIDACQVGGNVQVVAADRQPDSAPPGGGPVLPAQGALVTVSLTGAAPARTAAVSLGELQSLPSTRCLPGRGLLLQQTPAPPGSYLQLITPSGTMNWGAPLATAGEQPEAGNFPNPGELVDLGVQVAQFGYTGGRVLNAEAGQEITTLEPTPAFELQVWTGTELMAVTNTSNRLFVLQPDLPNWVQAAGSSFPESYEQGD